MVRKDAQARYLTTCKLDSFVLFLIQGSLGLSFVLLDSLGLSSVLLDSVMWAYQWAAVQALWEGDS